MAGTWFYTIDEHCQTPLSRSVQSNHMAITELLLRQEADDTSPSLSGSSALHHAACLGLHEAVATMLKEGANPDEADKSGETPLHKAARNGRFKSTQLLLEAGASVHAVNMLGLTPLHWVALNGRVDIAELLLEAGADPGVPDEALDGLTPTTLAEIMGYQALVTLLQTYSRSG